MKVHLAWLLVVPLLAGCLSGDAPDGSVARDQDDATSGAGLTVLTLVAHDRGTGEPSLGVTPDGVLFTNVGSYVYRSDDGGETWTDLGDPNPMVPNNDPDLAVDLDGTVWESRLYALVCNAVSVSRDGGASWTNSQAVCNLPVGDRQYIIPTRGGEAYLYWHQVPTFYQTVMKTTDHGQTWLPTLPAETPDHHLLVNEGSSWGGGGFYNDVTGSVFITYTRSPGVLDAVVEVADEAPGYSVTRDGLSWEEGTGPAFDGSRLGLGLVMGAADDAGNVYLTWGEFVQGEVHIFVSASRDDGVTWGDKIRIDTGNGSKVFPAIAAGADGHVAIAYYESSEPGFPDDATNWTVTLAWTDDVSQATSPDAWHHMPLADGVVKQGAICISGTTCTGDREFLDYFALERLPDGTVGAAYNTLDDDNGLRNVFARTAAQILGPAPWAA